MSFIRAVHTVYKWSISPLIGSRCRFYPSCSDYCCNAIEGHGVLIGLWLSCKRVLRCNPFCEGGIDPVPEKKEKLRRG